MRGFELTVSENHTGWFYIFSPLALGVLVPNSLTVCLCCVLFCSVLFILSLKKNSSLATEAISLSVLPVIERDRPSISYYTAYGI